MGGRTFLGLIIIVYCRFVVKGPTCVPTRIDFPRSCHLLYVLKGSLGLTIQSAQRNMLFFVINSYEPYEKDYVGYILIFRFEQNNRQMTVIIITNCR